MKTKLFTSAVLIIVTIVAIAPFMFTRGAIYEELDFSSTGEIGDTIAGTTAPIIGVISIILLFITLQNQIKFNRKQQEQMDEQAKIMREEQFKTTLFSLLAEQRDLLHSLRATYYGLSKNVCQKIRTTVNGQEFFSMAITELVFLFNSLDSSKYHSDYDEDVFSEIIESVYEQCYTGVNLPPELKKENENMINGVKREAYFSYFNDIFKVTAKDFNRYKSLTSMEEKISFVYDKYFTKRENSGCYFRHLYRILFFIEDSENIELSMAKNEDERERVEKRFYEYAQFVQAQMSTHEMLLVYYNSFSFPNLKRLLIKYCLLENLTIENLIKPEHYCDENFEMKHRPEYKWKD